MSQDLVAENAALRQHIAALEAQLQAQKAKPVEQHNDPSKNGNGPTSITEATFGNGQLNCAEIERYSRQVMLPDVGSCGTRALLNATVLVVGAGGLGSTCAMFLAAAGVGHLVIVDFDHIERSNLHRQVIHPDARVGMAKCLSAKTTCLQLNPTIKVEAIQERFVDLNGVELCKRCDVIVDCTDNVAGRYLLNDAAVLAGKPLISGSAMRWEGQLTVYNAPACITEDGKVGPCYRCVFPTPPPLSALGSCNESGVVGAIPGTIGCLQALEAQKVILLLDRNKRREEAGIKKEDDFCSMKTMVQRMLFFDGRAGTYRTMKLRPRQEKCCSCGNPEEKTEKIMKLASVGDAYAGIICAGSLVVPLPKEQRADAERFVSVAKMRSPGEKGNAVILDVRVEEQFNMCGVPGSVNLPWNKIVAASNNGKPTVPTELTPENSSKVLSLVASDLHLDQSNSKEPIDVYVLCRRGVDSSKATQLLSQAQKCLGDEMKLPNMRFLNVDGGLNACSKLSDVIFPWY